MLVVKNLGYAVGGRSIFKNISFTIDTVEKVAIVGRNGIGKTTLLRLLGGELEADEGCVSGGGNFAYLRQEQRDYSSVADVFGLEKEVKSFMAVENGTAMPEDYEILEGNWDCLDIIQNRMKRFDLALEPLRDFVSLSGGEKIRLILSSVVNNNVDFLLLDEPTNNMDGDAKSAFYDFIKNWQKGIILVSHDRELLMLMDRILELRTLGGNRTELFSYGGNYAEWQEMKNTEIAKLESDYQHSIGQAKVAKERSLKKLERMNKSFSRHGRLAEDGTIKAARTLFEMSSEKQILKTIVGAKEKLRCRENSITDIKNNRDISNDIYFKFSPLEGPKKILLSLENISFSYNDKPFIEDINLVIKSGDRVLLDGKNGSGKSTLLKIIVGEIDNYGGNVRLNTKRFAYLDQEYKLLNNSATIIGNIKTYNPDLENARDHLAKFLFNGDDIYKVVGDLSGGEKLRLALACVCSIEPLELLILDEPTNNLDLESIDILERVLRQYEGAILLASHDRVFREQLGDWVVVSL